MIIQPPMTLYKPNKINTAKLPFQPIIFNHFLFVNFSYILVVYVLPILPTVNSIINNGNPTSNVNIKNINKKAPPPYIPAIYGNFHIAPSPIADPALANMKPSEDFHCDSLCIVHTSFTPYYSLLR